MVNPMVPSWYQGSPESWNGTAKDSPGMWAWKKEYKWPWPIPKMTRYLAPIPAGFEDYYVPWPYWKRTLPGGAFTGLFPNAKGNDWSAVKPANYSEHWRPTGMPAPEGWDKEDHA